jgi:hypothetical protein
MLQLFFKTSAITHQEWENAYSQIHSIVTHFPLKLIRIEAYNGYQANLDKDHFELRENIGTPEESITFYGDWTSYTTGTNIRFYKNWDKYLKEELEGKEEEPDKPITWFPHDPYYNDGSLPQANGGTTQYGYIDTRGGAYEYAILAIAIMLENQLPGKVFLMAMEQHLENIEDVVSWLSTHFETSFDLPIYFDKIRLLHSFVQEYQNPMEAVCRMEHLFPNQYKRNIIFALENIGYRATFDCYADILSSNLFGTFGFSDVLNPWIAATQDLESTLALVAKSEQLTKERGKGKAIETYDLTQLLESFLNEFILWTPQQREELEHFYTNKEALETGDESLWGMIYRMTGNRIDICPMYATPTSLFEAFMYHAPKDGKKFKAIIDKWIETNVDAFDQLKQKLSKVEAITENESLSDEVEEDHQLDKMRFLNSYPLHERPFLELALDLNPAICDVETGIQNMLQRLDELTESSEYHEFIQDIKTNSRQGNISFIRRRIKRDVQCRTHPLFEQWLEEEMDENVLFYLTLLMSLKFYVREKAYVRYRILWDRAYWEKWRQKPTGA